MKRFLAATGFAVVALAVFALTDTASATNGVLDDFTTAYPVTAGTDLANCSTCHTSVPALNAYGSALRAASLNFAGIEGLDSDGDGFDNLQEIRNLTNPGDADNRPGAGTTATTSTTTTTVASLPQPAAAAQTPAPTTSVAPADARAFDAGSAGTVWLAVEDDLLVVDRVDTTWEFEVEMDDDGEVEVTFRNDGQEVEFEAELEDGNINTKIETESDDHGDHDSDDDDDDHGDDHDDDHDDDDDDDDDHHGDDHDDDDEDDHDD